MQVKLQVKFKIYRGMLKSWETLFMEASVFAASVGRDRLISISHSADQHDGVVTVWYWE